MQRNYYNNSTHNMFHYYKIIYQYIEIVYMKHDKSRVSFVMIYFSYFYITNTQ